MSHSTVVDRKITFLRQQKRILTRPIQTSNRVHQIAADGGIPEKVLRDVILKVNRDVKRHGREVYSQQMTQHVAEQVDLLYWESGAPSPDPGSNNGPDAGDDEPAVRQGEDLATENAISKLPLTWDTASDPTQMGEESMDVDQDDYLSEVTKIQGLSAQRLVLQQKLNSYRTFLSLLEPYRNPREHIQPNLVGRDAPLAPELGKTRTLAIRVAGRLGDKYGNAETPALSVDPADDAMMENDGRAKLKGILASW